jgi:hypothetical protein
MGFKRDASSINFDIMEGSGNTEPSAEVVFALCLFMIRNLEELPQNNEALVMTALV